MTIKTLSLLPGISLDHPQATWEIGPVGHHRDSDLVEESNWDSMLASYAAADPDGKDYEVHRFGHFAVGWIEEVAYRPGSKVSEVAATLRDCLKGHPILDEEALGRAEMEAVQENWHSVADELKASVLKVCRTWEGWDCADGEKLDEVSDEEWAGLASGYGETQEGWVKYSPSEVRKIASAWAWEAEISLPRPE